MVNKDEYNTVRDIEPFASLPISRNPSDVVMSEHTQFFQSSSRSAPIPDIYYFQNAPEVTSVQLILSFSLTVLLTASLTIFVQSP